MKISKILLGAAMFIAAPVVKGGCQMMAQNAPQEPIVVDTPFVHDPVMAYENGKYYLYCTGHGITQMTSTDRKHWTIVPQGVLKNSEIPAWTHDSVPGFTTHIWAPDVIRFKNKWYLAYSCSTFGKNTSAIGLLSNDPSPHIPSYRLPESAYHRHCACLCLPYPNKDRQPSCFCPRQHDSCS